MTGKAEMYQSNWVNGTNPVGCVEINQPAALWLTRPLTSAEARALVAQPERIVDVIAAVKRALAECQQTLIERENEGVQS